MPQLRIAGGCDVRGLLMTYPKDSAELKDRGLRFKRVGETSFACPMYGTKLKAEIL